MIIQGDCLIELKKLPSNSVDSIVTDPPYHLVSIVKRFGKKGSAPAKYGKDGSFGRLSKGFMGKEWDGVDENGIGIAYNVDLWAECLRVLKPGGHLLAFSGTRTYHKMASAIEDAGFEVRDMIEWVYGSGFPKSLNIGKAVDKLRGNERKIVGKTSVCGTFKQEYQVKQGYRPENNSGGYAGEREGANITKGNSEWEGWGTALKPAHEPICMARKPLAEKTVADNCLKWGTGGINIDESRVGTSGARFNGRNVDSDIYGKYGTAKPKEVYDYGRFPANLIHDNSEEVRECFPETKSGKLKSDCYEKDRDNNSIFAGGENFTHKGYEADSGNASRFFKSIIYNPKASKAERNKGCEGLEEKQSVGGGGGIGDYLDDVNSASGKFGSEKAPAKNNHPTVKPIALMEYLIKMVTLKGGTVLDPFMGSGSTGVAAKKNGYDFIGIELDKEYCEIAEKRINSFLL